MIYEIYQVVLDESDHVLQRTIGMGQARAHSPKVNAFYDLMLCNNPEQYFRDGHYTRTALIDGPENDLHAVFRIGNMPKLNDHITPLVGNVAPIDIGNIIRDGNGDFYVVETHSYRKLNPCLLEKPSKKERT